MKIRKIWYGPIQSSNSGRIISCMHLLSPQRIKVPWRMKMEQVFDLVPLFWSTSDYFPSPWIADSNFTLGGNLPHSYAADSALICCSPKDISILAWSVPFWNTSVPHVHHEPWWYWKITCVNLEWLKSVWLRLWRENCLPSLFVQNVVLTAVNMHPGKGVTIGQDSQSVVPTKGLCRFGEWHIAFHVRILTIDSFVIQEC